MKNESTFVERDLVKRVLKVTEFKNLRGKNCYTKEREVNEWLRKLIAGEDDPDKRNIFDDRTIDHTKFIEIEISKLNEIIDILRSRYDDINRFVVDTSCGINNLELYVELKNKRDEFGIYGELMGVVRNYTDKIERLNEINNKLNEVSQAIVSLYGPTKGIEPIIRIKCNSEMFLVNESIFKIGDTIDILGKSSGIHIEFRTEEIKKISTFGENRYDFWLLCGYKFSLVF